MHFLGGGSPDCANEIVKYNSSFYEGIWLNVLNSTLRCHTWRCHRPSLRSFSAFFATAASRVRSHSLCRPLTPRPTYPFSSDKHSFHRPQMFSRVLRGPRRRLPDVPHLLSKRSPSSLPLSLVAFFPTLHLPARSAFYVLKGKKACKVGGRRVLINDALASNLDSLPMNYVQMSFPWRKNPA